MLFFLLACGNVSNDPFLSDLEYLEVLPTEKNHTVRFEEEAEPESGEPIRDPPTLFALSVSVSQECNSFILGLLAMVDTVRSLPPSDRTENSRSWGPYDWENLTVSAGITREGEGEFQWEFLGDPGTGAEPFMYGTHYVGASVAAGDGQFVWRHGLVSSWTGGIETGELTVDYDNREGIDLLVDISDFSEAGQAPLDARYGFQVVDGEGDFQYRTVTDIGWGGDPTQISVRTRWFIGEAGRSDAVLVGEDGRTFSWSQCWDGSLNLVYQSDSLDYYEQVGEESLCVYPNAATVDRL